MIRYLDHGEALGGDLLVLGGGAGSLPALAPPSIGSVVPVIRLARSEARNGIVSATSSGYPWRDG